MMPHISLNVPANITAISEVSLGNIGSGPKPANQKIITLYSVTSSLSSGWQEEMFVCFMLGCWEG